MLIKQSFKTRGEAYFCITPKDEQKTMPTKEPVFFLKDSEMKSETVFKSISSPKTIKITLPCVAYWAICIHFVFDG